METLTKQQVFEAILKEREHQKEKWGDQPPSLPGFLMIIRHELAEAELGWMKNLDGKHAVMNELVQVAATAFAALERYGTSGCPASTNDAPVHAPQNNCLTTNIER